MAHVIGFHPHNARIGQPARPNTARPPLLAGFAATLRLWRRRMREREELGRWDERDMRDAGLTRADVLNEIAKPFWRG